jgi:crotonobetainyl-CoA:carnitine CoA-transferase CaiB-like acyl-CoA transferase
MGRLQTPRTPGISAEADAGLGPAPEIGEHGRAMLAELGIDLAAVERLAAEGVLRLPELS